MYVIKETIGRERYLVGEEKDNILDLQFLNVMFLIICLFLFKKNIENNNNILLYMFVI